MTLKDIDNICWFIPFRKLRDSIRELLTDIYKINIGINYVIYNLNNKNNDDTLVVSISGGFADQIYYYILSKKIELVYGKKIKYDINCDHIKMAYVPYIDNGEEFTLIYSSDDSTDFSI